MSGTFWDNRPLEQDDSEQELSPQEVAALTGTQVRSQRKVKEYVETEEDSFLEEIAPRQTKTISQALLRLEQGKLYQMLIEHDLFSDIDAHPQAIETVQKEMKDFITSRLEVLLGMRIDGDFSRPQEKAESPFTETEIQALKSLAKKLTGGLAQKIEEQPKSGSFSPVTNSDKAKSMLNKMSVKKIVPQNVVQKKVIQQKPIVQQKKLYKEPEKRFEDLTEQDLIERNAAIQNNKAYPKDVKPLPQLTPEQQRVHYEGQVNANQKTVNLVQAVLMAKNKGA